MNQLIPTKLKAFIIPFPPKNHFNYLYHCPRGHQIVMEGLDDYEHVEVVDNKDEADIYLLTYVPHVDQDKYNLRFIQEYLGKKLVVIDWQDESGDTNYLVKPDQCLAYFKRSWVSALNQEGIRSEINHPPNFYPFAYSIMKDYLRFPIINYYKRNVDIGCYLRPEQPNRAFILNVIQQIKSQLPHLNIVVGPVSSGNRSSDFNTTFDDIYFTVLAQTKILITSNPPLEGDSRLWESLSMNCCTIVDKMFTPISNKLENGKHILEYSFSDINTLVDHLREYLDNPIKAHDIAWAGYNFATEYHMPKNRMEYIIKTIRKLL